MIAARGATGHPDAPSAERNAPPRRHVLDLDDFTEAEIESILQNTDVMREVLRRDIKKVPTLRGRASSPCSTRPARAPAYRSSRPARYSAPT